jgi:FHS family L-fucose permease-like MFS transporter
MAIITQRDNIKLNYTEGQNYTRPFIVITTLFFMWAVLTNINDILIPHLKKACDLTDFQSSLVQSAFFIAYFVMSIPSGYVIKKIGYKNGLITGLGVMTLGALLFIPAAKTLNYNLFLIALFIVGSGITLLQVAANPYVSLLGKPETASTRLNLAQAFNSLGATLAPFVGGRLILSGIEFTKQQWSSMSSDQKLQYRLGEASAVIPPYAGLALALFLLALLIYFSKLPVIESETKAEVSEAGESIWKHTHLLLGVLGIMAYVGAEVSIGSFLIRFAGIPEIAGLKDVDAAVYPSIYMFGAMIGRFIGSAVLTKIKPGKAVAFNASIAVLLLLTGIFTKGYTALIAVSLVGLCNSILFPTIFTLGIARLGRFTQQGSSYLIMGIVGGAIIPPVMGLVSGIKGIQFAFIVPILCYIYILFYGLTGSKVKHSEE